MRFKSVEVAVIGTGCIGAEFIKRASTAGYSIVAAVNSREATGLLPATFRSRGDTAEVSSYLQHLRDDASVDLAVFALPSGDDGSTELGLMLSFLGHGIPVVTAGKAALSQHYDRLRPFLHRIGRRATVGGGTAMLHQVKAWLQPGAPCSMRTVANGTMAFMSWQSQLGRSLDEAAQAAVNLKFAEPPEIGQPLSVLKLYEAELRDVAHRKVPIILSELFWDRFGRACTPDDVKCVPVTEKDLRILAEWNCLDYVVEIGADYQSGVEPSVPGAIWCNLNGVYVRGRFCSIEDSDALALIPSGPGNALVARQGERTFAIAGLGAGPEPTVEAMMADLRELADDPKSYVTPLPPVRVMEHIRSSGDCHGFLGPGKLPDGALILAAFADETVNPRDGDPYPGLEGGPDDWNKQAGSRC